MRVDGYEADDIIATLVTECKNKDFQCRILSGDKDLMQLITDTTLMLKPDRVGGGWELIDRDVVLSEWGVEPNK